MLGRLDAYLSSLLLLCCCVCDMVFHHHPCVRVSACVFDLIDTYTQGALDLRMTPFFFFCEFPPCLPAHIIACAVVFIPSRTLVSKWRAGFCGADTGVRQNPEPVVPVRRAHPLRGFECRHLTERCVPAGVRARAFGITINQFPLERCVCVCVRVFLCMDLALDADSFACAMLLL